MRTCDGERQNWHGKGVLSKPVQDSRDKLATVCGAVSHFSARGNIKSKGHRKMSSTRFQSNTMDRMM